MLNLHWPANKKQSHTHIFHLSTLSFDHGQHSSRHHFNKLMQCHNTYFHLELCYSHALYWRWAWQSAKIFSSKSQRFLEGLKSVLCGGQSLLENDVLCSLNRSFSFNPMNPGTVIQENVFVIREEQKPLMEKPGHSVYWGSQLTSFFGGDLTSLKLALWSKAGLLLSDLSDFCFWLWSVFYNHKHFPHGNVKVKQRAKQDLLNLALDINHLMFRASYKNFKIKGTSLAARDNLMSGYSAQQAAIRGHFITWAAASLDQETNH